MKIENEQLVESWRDFLDLRLPLSVELGRVNLKIRDILALEAMSLIKLPRSTGEGVDVFTGDSKLVSGEIIAIEENAGVRINDVVDEEK